MASTARRTGSAMPEAEMDFEGGQWMQCTRGSLRQKGSTGRIDANSWRLPTCISPLTGRAKRAGQRSLDCPGRGRWTRQQCIALWAEIDVLIQRAQTIK